MFEKKRDCLFDDERRGDVLTSLRSNPAVSVEIAPTAFREREGVRFLEIRSFKCPAWREGKLEIPVDIILVKKRGGALGILSLREYQEKEEGGCLSQRKKSQLVDSESFGGGKVQSTPKCDRRERRKKKVESRQLEKSLSTTPKRGGELQHDAIQRAPSKERGGCLAPRREKVRPARSHAGACPFAEKRRLESS